MGGRSEGGQSVGTATGKVTIDTSGVVAAERVVDQSSKKMTQSFTALNAPLANIANSFRNAQASANAFKASDLGTIRDGLRGLAGDLAPLSAIGGLITAGGLAAASTLNSINTSFAVFLGSTQAAQKELANIRKQADETGQPFIELAQSAQSLLSLSKAQNVEVGKLVTLGQQLKAVDPTARAIDVSLATREFLSGNARSLYSRFEGLDKSVLDGILKGATNAQQRLEGLQKYLNKLGFSTDILKQFGASGAYAFQTLQSEITEALGTAFLPLLNDFVLPAVKAFSGFVRTLRETNPGLLQFGSVVAVAAAAAAPLLLVTSQLITAFQTLKTLQASSTFQGLGKIAAGGLAAFAGAQVGSLAAKGLANAGVTTGDLGRVAKGEDPLTIVSERLNQGLVILVDAILSGTKPIVQGFTFAGVLIQHGGEIISASFDAAKAIIENSIGNLSQSFGTIIKQLADNFSGLFDTTKLREFGNNLEIVGKVVSDTAQKKLVEAGLRVVDPLVQAGVAAKKAGDDFDVAHREIVVGLSQGLGLIPVAQAADEATTALGKVAEAANPLAESFKANEEKLRGAADSIIKARKSAADEVKKQQEERDISALRDVFDFNLARARANRDFQQNIAQQDEDFYRNRERSIADFNKTLQNEALAQQQAEAKQKADFAQQSVRDAIDHGKRLEEIERDTRDSVRKAASKLDAIGVLEAQQSGIQQVNDENAQYALAQSRRLEDFNNQLVEQAQYAKESRDQRILDFQQQLVDSQAAHDQQRQRDLAANAQRLADEDFDRNLRLSRQQEDYQRQDKLRSDALKAQITDIINGVATETKIRRTWVASFVNSLVSAGNHVKNFAAFVDQAVSHFPQEQVQQYGAPLVPQQFATGGRPQLNRPFSHSERGLESALFSDGMLGLLTRPATIIPAQQTAALLGGGRGGVSIANFNPQLVFGDIGKYEPAQIKDIALEAMNEALDALREKIG